jgi:hypothetical protein
MDTYNILPRFLKCILTFGRKNEENEFEFPGFAARQSREFHSSGSCREESRGMFYHSKHTAKFSIVNRYSGSAEAAYMLRRVEQHGRTLVEGQSPWSIRQTAVYHRYRYVTDAPKEFQPRPRSMFVLVAASPNVEMQLSQCLNPDALGFFEATPCSVQRLLVADSLKGWMDYMAWLECQLKEQVRNGSWPSEFGTHRVQKSTSRNRAANGEHGYGTV